ncbi:hypothetical protein PPACK8108_LOCUS6708 [Phakopsora pachyrhizi]|uniref:Uncharacterized protein n=1 Tax=Phakopsora pachyrhizi TaxID=170000 RepID=A0AAV0AV12_PHAPC|nr:hypothetical protein PPACK8108_LOCUS6708 [Phakopsora pachyrhizi]
MTVLQRMLAKNAEAHDQIRGAVSAAIIKSASFESSAGDEKMVILGSDLTESSDEDGDVIAEIRRDTNTSQGYHDDKDYNENEDVEDEDNKNEQDWDEEDGDSNNNIHDKHGAHNTDFGIDLAEGAVIKYTHEAENAGSIAYQMNSLADVHEGTSIESSDFINVSHNVGENRVKAARIENGSTL